MIRFTKENTCCIIGKEDKEADFISFYFLLEELHKNHQINCFTYSPLSSLSARTAMFVRHLPKCNSVALMPDESILKRYFELTRRYANKILFCPGHSAELIPYCLMESAAHCILLGEDKETEKAALKAGLILHPVSSSGLF